MRHIAIVGSGPAGFYTAEAAAKLFGQEACIDIIDQLPVPYGLIRFGVAPDHQTIKAASRRYEKTAELNQVRFVGNVAVGRDISIAELQGLYDAVVLATGAPDDRTLEIAGSDLPGVYGSAAFVGWYNGHPNFRDLAPRLDADTVVVIGNGNVALDVARILAKTEAEFAGSDIVDHALRALVQSKVRRIVLLGRRGPHQIAMTPKELGELGHLARARPMVDIMDFPPLADDALLEPGQRKSVTHLRDFHMQAASHRDKPMTLEFDFYAMPLAIEGNGSVQRVRVERTTLDSDLRSIGTGDVYMIDAQMVISCIGYRTPPIDEVPFEVERGRFANAEGRILPGLYCAGWARRGPSGTIGTNKPDGFAIADKIAEDIGAGAAKAGRSGLTALLAERGVREVSFADWKQIERAEEANARSGSPREKFVTRQAMLDVLSDYSDFE